MPLGFKRVINLICLHYLNFVLTYEIFIGGLEFFFCLITACPFPLKSDNRWTYLLLWIANVNHNFNGLT